ncbi:MAG: ATP-NAD kinase family protein [Promethearchaeia archaeon]
MKKIGLIVNPIAGMGGSVGLKGTDGNAYQKSLKLGADPITPQRMSQFLDHLEFEQGVRFLVAPNKMGEEIIKKTDFNFEVIGNLKEEKTKAADTKRIAKKLKEKEIDILIFCGGDGTARDIYDAIDLDIPVLALPSGVKMFSSVFALNPKAASEMLEGFIDESLEVVEKEVLDIDEKAFRNGQLKSKLYGYLKIPKLEKLIQGGKESSKSTKSIKQKKNEIAQFVISSMKEDVLYFLGPGTTVKTISDQLDISKALLGIDAVYNKKAVEIDINEKEILDLLNKYDKVKIVISPIGGQGFIFGRGNKQFTPEVLKKVGKENILVISTENKVKGLKCLRVDTGDEEVDDMLRGYLKVIIGKNQKLMIEVD